MAKLYDNLVAPEWRIAIYPHNLADATMRSFRMLSARIAAIISGDLSHNTTRPLYRTLTIPLSEIIYVNAPCIPEDTIKAIDPANPPAVSIDSPTGAGITTDVVAGGVIEYTQANYPHRCGKYRFKSTIGGIDIFGGDGVHPAAIRGRDFYYLDGYYWFNKHPSVYGSVGSVDRLNVLSLLCIGGDLSADLDPLGIGFHGVADQTTRDAIWTSLYGSSPMGVTNALIYTTGGCKLSAVTIKRVWEEKDFYIALTTDAELLWAPKNSGIVFTPGSPADLSAVTNNYQYFGVRPQDKTYILTTGLHKATDYPEILHAFPELGLIDDVYFSGAQLLRLLTQGGCTFICWQYIKPDEGSVKALSQYATTGKVAISTKVEAIGGTLVLSSDRLSTAISQGAGGTISINTTSFHYNHS